MALLQRREEAMLDIPMAPRCILKGHHCVLQVILQRGALRLQPVPLPAQPIPLRLQLVHLGLDLVVQLAEELVAVGLRAGQRVQRLRHGHAQRLEHLAQVADQSRPRLQRVLRAGALAASLARARARAGLGLGLHLQHGGGGHHGTLQRVHRRVHPRPRLGLLQQQRRLHQGDGGGRGRRQAVQLVRGHAGAGHRLLVSAVHEAVALLEAHDDGRAAVVVRGKGHPPLGTALALLRLRCRRLLLQLLLLHLLHLLDQLPQRVLLVQQVRLVLRDGLAFCRVAHHQTAVHVRGRLACQPLHLLQDRRLQTALLVHPVGRQLARAHRLRHCAQRVRLLHLALRLAHHGRLRGAQQVVVPVGHARRRAHQLAAQLAHRVLRPHVILVHGRVLRGLCLAHRHLVLDGPDVCAQRVLAHIDRLVAALDLRLQLLQARPAPEDGVIRHPHLQLQLVHLRLRRRCAHARIVHRRPRLRAPGRQLACRLLLSQRQAPRLRAVLLLATLVHLRLARTPLRPLRLLRHHAQPPLQLRHLALQHVRAHRLLVPAALLRLEVLLQRQHATVHARRPAPLRPQLRLQLAHVLLRAVRALAVLRDALLELVHASLGRVARSHRARVRVAQLLQLPLRLLRHVRQVGNRAVHVRAVLHLLHRNLLHLLHRLLALLHLHHHLGLHARHTRGGHGSHARRGSASGTGRFRLRGLRLRLLHRLRLRRRLGLGQQAVQVMRQQLVRRHILLLFRLFRLR
mmetsp:Transcript_24629/g.79245  ORF Transcript_24629/g.79245 Transcript_24629/m.79245 type:complete len:740 (+) Transcript_24629:149-2368(+)